MSIDKHSTDGGISMRFLQPMVYHPESSVSIVCGCGKTFDYFGLEATEKARDFMRNHDCRLRASEGNISVQRIGDETV